MVRFQQVGDWDPGLATGQTEHQPSCWSDPPYACEQMHNLSRGPPCCSAREGSKMRPFVCLCSSDGAFLPVIWPCLYVYEYICISMHIYMYIRISICVCLYMSICCVCNMNYQYTLRLTNRQIRRSNRNGRNSDPRGGSSATTAHPHLT